MSYIGKVFLIVHLGNRLRERNFAKNFLWIIYSVCIRTIDPVHPEDSNVSTSRFDFLFRFLQPKNFKGSYNYKEKHDHNSNLQKIQLKNFPLAEKKNNF